MSVRAATHANSWYSGSKDSLNAQLDSWLEDVPAELEGVGEIPPSGARIIIAP